MHQNILRLTTTKHKNNLSQQTFASLDATSSGIIYSVVWHFIGTRGAWGPSPEIRGRTSLLLLPGAENPTYATARCINYIRDFLLTLSTDSR